MPIRPEATPERSERAKTDPRTPRERLAVELRDRIVAGEFPVGGYLPGIKQLSAQYGVAASTAHRAVVLLKEWGMINGEPGQRAKVLGALDPVSSAFEQVQVEIETSQEVPGGRQLLDLEVRRAGQVVARLTADADPRSADDLRRLLVGAVRRSGGDTSDIADYEMDIRNGDQLLTTFVVF
jgi:DNA-binding GntR family transcriptional regulator